METEKIKVLANGKLVDADSFEATGFDATVNEPVDRSKVTNETKKELTVLLKKLPEIKPVLEILLGKTEVTKLAKVK